MMSNKYSIPEIHVFSKKVTCQKHGQIVPTPRGSILPHTKPSQVPYNAQNRFLSGYRPYLVIFPIIPYYSLLSTIGP